MYDKFQYRCFTTFAKTTVHWGKFSFFIYIFLSYMKADYTGTGKDLSWPESSLNFELLLLSLTLSSNFWPDGGATGFLSKSLRTMHLNCKHITTTSSLNQTFRLLFYSFLSFLFPLLLHDLEVKKVALGLLVDCWCNSNHIWNIYHIQMYNVVYFIINGWQLCYCSSVTLLYCYFMSSGSVFWVSTDVDMRVT